MAVIEMGREKHKAATQMDRKARKGAQRSQRSVIDEHPYAWRRKAALDAPAARAVVLARMDNQQSENGFASFAFSLRPLRSHLSIQSS
jgi:hypothetical protein